MSQVSVTPSVSVSNVHTVEDPLHVALRVVEALQSPAAYVAYVGNLPESARVEARASVEAAFTAYYAACSAALGVAVTGDAGRLCSSPCACSAASSSVGSVVSVATKSTASSRRRRKRRKSVIKLDGCSGDARDSLCVADVVRSDVVVSEVAAGRVTSEVGCYNLLLRASCVRQADVMTFRDLIDLPAESLESEDVLRTLWVFRVAKGVYHVSKDAVGVSLMQCLSSVAVRVAHLRLGSVGRLAASWACSGSVGVVPELTDVLGMFTVSTGSVHVTHLVHLGSAAESVLKALAAYSRVQSVRLAIVLPQAWGAKLTANAETVSGLVLDDDVLDAATRYSIQTALAQAGADLTRLTFAKGSPGVSICRGVDVLSDVDPVGYALSSDEADFYNRCLVAFAVGDFSRVGEFHRNRLAWLNRMASGAAVIPMVAWEQVFYTPHCASYGRKCGYVHTVGLGNAPSLKLPVVGMASSQEGVDRLSAWEALACLGDVPTIQLQNGGSVTFSPASCGLQLIKRH